MNMNAEEIVGRATPEETRELFRESLRALPETDMLAILSGELTLAQLDELTTAMVED